MLRDCDAAELGEGPCVQRRISDASDMCHTDAIADEAGDEYYYHAESGETQWEIPTQHSAVRQMKTSVHEVAADL